MNHKYLKILFVGYRDQSHSSAGGYDWIAKCPNTDCLWGENVPFGFIPVSTRGKFLNIFFLSLISRFKRRHYDVMHYFYGEMLPYYKHSDKHKIVATIHNKVDEQNISLIKKLQSADGVISLSSSQAKLLKDKYGVNSRFIPHGFNNPIYCHKCQIVDKKQINIVVSGSNYRDEDTLYDIVSLCQDRRPDVFFHLLGQPIKVKERLSSYANVKCYPRLDDDDYFSIMADCDFNFLPLTFATANNTLLEAQFLGVKSILPEIDGVMDYAAPAPLNFFYNDREDAYKIFLNISKTSVDEELIKFAEKFKWENIYPALLSFYESLFNKEKCD